MFFNSLPFIFLFLPFTVIGFFLLRGGKKGQAFLTLVSLFFYFLLIPEYLPLLLISISFNYCIGIYIIKLYKQGNGTNNAQNVLILGILGDLGLLGYYKYFHFAIINLDSFFRVPLSIDPIILPLGISFFTFTQIAFLVDSYRGEVEHLNLISYFQFVTFFPHLIAGPIYHHADIIPQMENLKNVNPDWTNMNLGVFFFFFGLAKKVIIADTLATIATPIFNAVANGGTPFLFEAWIGVLAYTMQIYFDFSGYCDMAIGIALLFNIRFPINFFSPYTVTSIIDFWRCWNISLSNFLRDYLYIPLGGNRVPLPIQIRNLMITMLLGGLWHGAGWTFIIWGGLHGLYLIINHLWRKTGIHLHSVFCWGLTFLAVVIGWVFFRADSVISALKILAGMAGLNGVSLPLSLPGFLNLPHYGITPMSNVNSTFAVVFIIIAMSIVLLLPNLYELTSGYNVVLANNKLYTKKRFRILNIPLKYRVSLRWSFIVAIISALAIISVQTTSEFLYFQF